VESPLALKSAVIFQGKNFGDLLLATSVERVLRANFPCLRIIWVVRDGAQSIVSHLPTTEFVFSTGASILDSISLAQKIKSKLINVDLFLDLHGARRAGLLSFLIRARYSVRVREARATFFSYETHKVPHSQPVFKQLTIEKNLDCLRAIGLPVQPQLSSPTIEGFPTSTVVERLGLSSEKYLLVHPGTRWLFKTLRVDQWASILDYLAIRFSCPIILSGDNSEAEVSLCDGIVDKISFNSARIVNLAGLIDGAKFFVGVDSFASHIANATSTPGVVFFGPTKDRVWGPPDGSSVDLIVSDRHPCRPCDRDGCDGSKVSDCLVSLTTEEIHRQLEPKILEVLN
jgi:heptosyltransferase III